MVEESKLHISKWSLDDTRVFKQHDKLALIMTSILNSRKLRQYL